MEKMRKNPWLENSMKNLIHVSEAGSFSEALAEWSFTGGVVDHEEPIEVCELCEHEELRYHYEIHNSMTENRLWVGSSCILKFQDINVYDDDGNRLVDDEKRKKQLEKALKEKLIDLMLDSLRELWRKDKSYRKYTENSVKFFKEKGGFLPEVLTILFLRMKQSQIQYNPENFPIYLRSDWAKEQLKMLDMELLNLIKPSFSAQQLDRFIHLF